MEFTILLLQISRAMPGEINKKVLDVLVMVSLTDEI